MSRLAELFRVPGEQVADRVEQTVAQLRDAEKELEKLRAQLVLGGAAALADAGPDVRGVAYVGTEAPEGTAGNDVRTLAQEIRGKIDAGAAGGGRGGLPGERQGVAHRRDQRGGQERGLSAAELVKGALSGRGGGNADLAQGGGVPADQAPGLLAAVEKAVADA